MWRATEKRAWLTQTKDLNGVQWQTLAPDAKNNWITEGLHADFDAFLPMGTKEAKAAWGVTVKAIFKNYSRGAETTRDEWMYDFNRSTLEHDAEAMISTYTNEVLRWIEAGRPKDIDDFVLDDEKQIKWSSRLKEGLKREERCNYSSHKVRSALYRPFTRKFLYFDSLMTHRQGQFPKFFPTSESEAENTVIWLKVGSEWPMFALATNAIPDLMPSGGSQCFPFYTYAEDGSNRTENITDWALLQFRAAYGDAVSKRDIFHYVYALLHHPAYRAHYAENLKKSLPRIPLLGAAGASTTFAQFAAIGAQLMQLHLNYESAPEYALRWVETGTPFSYRVEKMKWTADKSALIVNNSLTLEGFPPEAFAYKLGNRSALDWLVDQYQTKTDARSGLSSDPNRENDEEYIVRLIARVTHVSLETQKLIAQLPEPLVTGLG